MPVVDQFEPAILKPKDGEDLDHAASRRRLPDFDDSRHRGAGDGRLIIDSKLGALIGPGTQTIVSIDLEFASRFEH
jgi:hypothetical protein